MNFLGTLISVLVALGLALITLTILFQDIFWPVFLLVAAVIALALHMYMELSDRLDAIEQHLGLKEEDTKTLTEQLSDNDETAP